ncbi:30S ribosomal protein S15 [bacterium]|nr:30S ribosomal protein S15 [bacterium]
MTINLKNEVKSAIVEKFGKTAKDTGSVETQIALLTEKISELTEHLKTNQKDFQGRRGLLMMVGRRKRLLSYLKDRNLDDYRKLIKELNIRETK